MKIIGKFPEYNHPNDAEEYILSNFTITETIETASKVVTDLISKKKINWFICPSCKKQQSELNHGDAYECECGLKIQNFGNTLYLWL